MCKIYRIKPDDPWFEDLDPVQKQWMYESWLGDQIDDAELAKNHAYLLASFSHPEAVQQILGEGNVHASTDEEFEESSNIVRNMNLKALGLQDNPQNTRKRKRQRLVNKE